MTSIAAGVGAILDTSPKHRRNCTKTTALTCRICERKALRSHDYQPRHCADVPAGEVAVR